MRPGITGWAQIHGRTSLPLAASGSSSTSGTSSTARCGSTCEILVRTVPMLLSPEHVYNEARGDWGEVVDPAGHAEVTPDAPGGDTQA